MRSKLHARDDRSKKSFLIVIALAVALFSSPGLALSCNSGSLSDTCTISSNQTVDAGTTISGSGSIVMESGGILFNETNNESFKVDIGGNFTMKSGSKIRGNPNISATYIKVNENSLINASRLGYRGGRAGGENGLGPGAGKGSSAVAAGGAGYGGDGGSGGSDSGDGGEGGPKYGNTTQPVFFGSGGGAGDFREKDGDPGGGDGGGRIVLKAVENLTINGTLLANGENGSKGYSEIVGGGSNPGGGGSGGTVLIDGDYVSGFGEVSSTGGRGGIYNEFEGGGGSGGRVSFRVGKFVYNGGLSVTGGQGYVEGGTGTLYPFAILCDEGTVGTTCRVLDTAKVSKAAGSGDLIVEDSGSIESAGDLALNFSDIQVNEGGVIEAGGKMNLSGGNELNITGKLNSTREMIWPSGSDVIMNNSRILTGKLMGEDVDLTAGWNYSLRVNDVENLDSTVDMTKLLSSYSKSNANLWARNGTMRFARMATMNLGDNNLVVPGDLELAGNLNISATDITIEEGGLINGSMAGYEGGESGSAGGGSGGTVGTGSYTGDLPGAGFGGIGGDSESGRSGGPSYGNMTSFLWGSGAGGSSNVDGGSGGGKIAIRATNQLDIEGKVLAKGGSGADGFYDTGGGSGGTIRLRTSDIFGNGVISVKGGDAPAGGGAGAAGRIHVYYDNGNDVINRSYPSGGESDDLQLLRSGGNDWSTGAESGTIIDCDPRPNSICPGQGRGQYSDVKLRTNTTESTDGTYFVRDMLGEPGDGTDRITDSFISWKENTQEIPSDVNATYKASGLKPDYLIKVEKDGSAILERDTSSGGRLQFTAELGETTEFYLAEGYNPEINPEGESLYVENTLINDEETNKINFTARDNQTGLDIARLWSDQYDDWRVLDGPGGYGRQNCGEDGNNPCDGDNSEIDYTEDWSLQKDLQNIKFTWQDGSDFKGTSNRQINFKAEVIDARGNTRNISGSFLIDGQNPNIDRVSGDPSFDVDIDNPYTVIEFNSSDSSGLTTYEGFNSVDMFRIIERTNTSGNYSMIKKNIVEDTYCDQDDSNFFQPDNDCENKYTWKFPLNNSQIEETTVDLYATDKADNREKYSFKLDFQNITVSHDFDKRTLNSSEFTKITGDSLLLPNNEDPNGNHDLASEDHGTARVYVYVNNGTGPGYIETTDSGFRLDRFNKETYLDCGGSNCVRRDEDDGWFKTNVTSEVAGTHQAKTVVIDDDNVQGVEITNFNVTLDIRRPNTSFSTPDTSFLDINRSNHNLNLSTFVTRSTDSDVDMVEAVIDTPAGGENTYYLDNNTLKNRSQRWNKVIDTAIETQEKLGEYNISYTANTSRGIGSNIGRDEFFIQDIKTSLQIDKQLYTPVSPLELNGTAKLLPNNTYVNGSKPNATVKVYMDDELVADNVQMNGTGFFEKTVETPLQGGFHEVRVEPVNTHYIKGWEKESFKVLVDVNTPRAEYLETGDQYLDVDTLNREINMSTYVTNSTDDISKAEVEVERPFESSTASYQLQNTTFTNRSQRWYRIFDMESDFGNVLGEYEINFSAETVSGIGSTVASEDFFLQNLSVGLSIGKTTMDWDETTTIGGTVLLEPNDTGVDDTLNIFLDGQPLRQVAPGGDGSYGTNLDPPETAGTHVIKTNITNPEGIQGNNTQEFDIKIAIQDEKTHGVKTGNLHANPGENINFSVKIPEFNIANDLKVSAIEASIYDSSNSLIAVKDLSGDPRGGTWNHIYKEEPGLGNYTVEFNAILNNSYSVQQISEHDFEIRNVSVTQNLGERSVNATDNLPIEGSAWVEPTDKVVSTEARLFRNTRGNWNNFKNTTIDAFGDYSTGFRTPVAGTHGLRVNVTNQNGITGWNYTTYNVSLNISEEETEFNYSGSSFLDVDDENHLVNVSAFVSNSTDSLVDYTEAEITSPDGTTQNYMLTNTEPRSDSGYWYRQFNTTSDFSDQLGVYDIRYSAETERSIGSNVRKANFTLDNISVTKEFDDRSINYDKEDLVFNGTARYQSDNDLVKNEDVRVAVDDSTNFAQGSTDGSGDYSFDISAPTDAGRHNLTVWVNDSEGISGLEHTMFETLIELQQEKAVSESTTTRHANLGDKVNLSVYVPGFSISNDNQLSYVRAEIETPDGSKTNYTMSDTTGGTGGTFRTSYFSTDQLGAYNVTYYAELDSGFDSQEISKTSFVVENLSVEENLGERTVNSNESLTVSGDVNVLPGGDQASGTARIYRNTTGSFESIDNITLSSGSYSEVFKTVVAGTHDLVVNVTDTNGINGTNQTQFNTTLGISDLGTRFKGTGSDTLDIKNNNSNLNVSAFVTNSTDSLVNEVWAEVTVPNGTVDTVSLSNTELKDSSQTWYSVINVSERYEKTSGAYDIEYFADTERGIGSNTPATQFYIQSIKIRAILGERTFGPGDSVTVNGTAKLVSNGETVDNEEVTVALDDSALQPDPITSTNGSGFYEHTFTAPEAAGVHDFRTNITNDEGVTGFNRSEFSILINQTDGRSYGFNTGNQHVNLNETVNISVDIPETNIDDAKKISAVTANLTRPNGSYRQVELTGPGTGGTWYKDFNNTSKLGDYQIDFNSNLTTGFTKQINESTSFSVENVTVGENFSTRTAEPLSPMKVFGNTTLLPEDEDATGDVKITRYVEGRNPETVYSDTLNATGGYEHIVKTGIAGTHKLEVNITDSNGINGSIRRKFNVTLNITQQETVFQKTGTDTIDVGANNSVLDISAYLSNSSTSLVSKAVAQVTAPNGSQKNVSLESSISKDVSNTWKETLNTSKFVGDLMGEFETKFYAETGRGIGSVHPVSSFRVNNLTITENLNDSQVNLNDSVKVSGFVEKEPGDTNVSGEKIQVYVNGSKVSNATTQSDGSYVSRFKAPTVAENYSVKVNITEGELKGLNRTILQVYNLSAGIDPEPRHVFRNSDEGGDIQFNDTLISNEDNPGPIENIDFIYSVPSGFDAWSVDPNVEDLNPGENTSHDPIYDITSFTDLGPHTISAEATANKGIRAEADTTVTVWSKSQADFYSPPDTISREQDSYLINTTVNDTVTGSELEGITTEFYVDGNLISTVESNSTGYAQFNWSVEDYTTGDHELTVRTANESAKYINSSGQNSTTTIDLSGKIRFEDYIAGNNPVFRQNSSSPSSTSLQVRLINSMGDPIEDANVTYEINGTVLSKLTTSDGYAFDSYNPRKEIIPGNYTLNITARKENYSKVRRNESLIVKGIINATQKRRYDIYRRGLEYKQNLSVENEYGENISADVIWTLNGTEMAEGRAPVWSPSIIEDLGQQNLTANVTREFFRPDIDSRDVMIYGNAEIYRLDPPSSTLLPNNDYNITAKIVDSDLTTGISSIPVNLTINDTQVYDNNSTSEVEGFTTETLLTNGTGHVKLQWAPSESDYRINASIRDNETLKYNVTDDLATSDIEIARKINLENFTVNESEIFRNDTKDPHTANFTINISETSDKPGNEPADLTNVTFTVGEKDEIWCVTNSSGVCEVRYNASEEVPSGTVDINATTDRTDWNNLQATRDILIKDSLDARILRPDRTELVRDEKILLNASAVSDGEEVDVDVQWTFRNRDISKDQKLAEWDIPEAEPRGSGTLKVTASGSNYGTDIDTVNAEVFGHSNVNFTSQTNTDQRLEITESAEIGCEVYNDLNLMIGGYDVDFKRNSTKFASVATDTEGEASTRFEVPDKLTTYNVSCVIEDNDTSHYRAKISQDNRLFETYDSTPPQVGNISIRPAEIQPGDKFNVTFNVSDRIGISDVNVQVTEIDGTRTDLNVHNITGGGFTANYTTASGVSGTYEIEASAEDTSGNVGFDLGTITADPGGNVYLDPSDYTVDNLTDYENETVNVDVKFDSENKANYTNITTSKGSDGSPIYFNDSRYSCGNISGTENCTTTMEVEIARGSNPGTVYGVFTAEWMNLNQSERNTVKEIMPIEIAENPVLREEYGNWVTTIPHGSSRTLTTTIGSGYRGFVLNSTGNIPVKDYDAEFTELLATGDRKQLQEEWVTLSNTDLSKIEAGEVIATGANLTIPNGTISDSYVGTVEFTTDNAGTIFRNISVDVPRDPDFRVLEDNISTNAVVNQTYTLDRIDIRNTGNMNLTAETSVSGNASENVFADPHDLPIQETVPAEVQYQNFTDNETYFANVTFESENTYEIQNDIVRIRDSANVTINPVKFNLTLDNTTKKVRAKPGDTITSEFDTTLRDSPATENLTFNPVVRNVSADVTFQNGSEGNHNVEFSLPDLQDGKLYDFQMMVNQTELNITTWDTVSDKFYIPDVTDPTILSVNAEDTTVGKTVNLTAEVTDNHYLGVRNVTATVTKPSGNKTTVNTSIVDGMWTYILEDDELEGVGDYKVEFQAYDPAGNTANTTTMFRYSERTSFSGSFVDAAGTAQQAQLTFQDSDSDKVLGKINTSSSKDGDYEADLLEGTYDIRIEYSDNEVMLDNAEVNDSVSNAVKLDEISPSISPYADPDHTPESVLMGLGGETNLSIESSTIELDYEQYQENIPTGRSLEEAVISRCSDYDYNDISCDGTYELYNISNTSVDRAESTISITTDGFSVYTAFFPGNNFMETDTDNSTDGDGDGSGGGGGGGGGSLPATQENVSELEDRVQGLTNPLEIQDSEIEVSLQPGEKETKVVRVLNNRNVTTPFRSNVSSNIEQFISAETPKEVPPNSLGNIRLNISVNGTPEYEIYRGTLFIESDDAEKTIPITIRIQERQTYVAENSVGIQIRPEQNVVNPGQNLSFRVSVTPSQSLLGDTITLDYMIRRPGPGGQVVSLRNNAHQFQGIYNNRTTINIPDTTPTGEYVLEVRAQYQNNQESAESSSITGISVRESFFNRTFLGISYGLLLTMLATLLIGGVGGYFGYRKYMSYVKAQRRYKQEIDQSSLPGPSEEGGSAYIGKLADRGNDAYLGLDQLTTHALVAGATGSGKSVTGQGVVEEALEQGVNVIVLDPTAQWSGYLRKCTSDDMLNNYSEFDMSPNDARAYDGNIRAIDSPDDEIDIQYLLQNEEESGSIVTFSLHKLESDDIEQFASSIIKQVFEANCSEREHLDTLIVFDEAHRLLEKFGGSGEGLNQLERGAREFRKWGIGMLLLSQVISDFPSEVRTNVGTKVQMRTRNQDDLDHYKDNYGMDTVRSIVKSNVGTGMIQNSDYNGGNPYFVEFRPLKHSVHRLSDEELDKYEEYNEKIDEVEEKIQQLEDQGEDVYEYRSNLKLCRKNLRKGSFNLVDIYLDELKEQLPS